MINIGAIVKAVPGLKPHLSSRARYMAALSGQGGEYKTYEFFLDTVTRLVRSVYAGNIAGDFIDVMANLIQGQINQAVIQAWQAEGLDGPFPGYLQEYASDLIISQFPFVDQYYRDIVDARIDGASIEPLLVRAQMWANRWNEAYSGARERIAQENGGKLKWVYGEAEHCDTCLALNGLVAYATEWDTAGFRPQNAPNTMLDCEGWNCKCRFETTAEKRSPKVFETLMNIAISRRL